VGRDKEEEEDEEERGGEEVVQFVGRRKPLPHTRDAQCAGTITTCFECSNMYSLMCTL
jgi:hypothetical protein